FDSDGDSFSSVRQVKTFSEATGANLGPGTATETTKRITWDVSQDLGTSGFANVSVEVYANDGRALIDVQFVEIPANIPNSGDSDLTISTWPITAGDMQTAWYWLIATDDPVKYPGTLVTFNDGQVFGNANSGAFNGQLLVSDAGTTTQGEDFLC